MVGDGARSVWTLGPLQDTLASDGCVGRLMEMGHMSMFVHLVVLFDCLNCILYLQLM